MSKRLRAKSNGPRPEGTHSKRLGEQVKLSVRRRAEAHQGGARSGALKIDSKGYEVKI